MIVLFNMEGQEGSSAMTFELREADGTGTDGGPVE